MDIKRRRIHVSVRDLPNIFKLSGEVQHCHDALLPEPDDLPCYVQIYFLESGAAADAWMQNPANHPLRQSLLLDLHDMVTEVNPFVPIYKTAHERLLAEGAHADQPNVSLSLHFAQHTDQQCYTIPTALTEVTAIIPYAPNADTQDIMLCPQNPPVVKPSCSVFMTAILPLMLFTMFCSSHLETLAGVTRCLSTPMDMGVNLAKLSITNTSCMSIQMNPLHCCMGGNFSSNLLWRHGHALSRVNYHGSDLTKEHCVLPMLGIILGILASPLFCLQAILEVHEACSNFARIHMLLLLLLGPKGQVDKGIS